MPDQSTAATEHSIIQEITAPLHTLPDDPLAVVNADFPAALRGYDRLAVDAYVQQTRQLVAELQATRSPEAAVRRALERVGEQISGILQRAHETAEEITAQSRREAEERLEKARIEAAEILAGAHRRVTDLDAETDRIWAERHRIIDDARELAQQLIALAEPAAERFPAAETTPYDDEVTTTRAPIVTGSKPAAEQRLASEDEVFEDDEPVADESVYVRYEPEHERLDEDPDEPDRMAQDEPEAESVGHRPESGDAADHGPVGAAAGSTAADEDPEDIEETVAFKPLDSSKVYDEREEAADSPETTPPPRSPRPPNRVIPPASQAANRRTTQ
jgi:cell division septum initiation protein DivIVA